MHDLATIRRLNAEAHAHSITQAQAQGRHVVAEYAGLHLMTTAIYKTAEEALAALKQPAQVGDSRAYHPPLPPWHGARRDQSEDRPVRPVVFKGGNWTETAL